MTDADRIAGLERAVRSLLFEVQALRDEVRVAELPKPVPGPFAPRPVQRPPAPPPPPAPAVRPAPQPVQIGLPQRDPIDIDVEGLVGRYGTLALATLTILLGLGAFLRWAVVHHLLGPVMRVSLGAVLAVALATVGWRVRRKAVVFGNALLGLSLAAVHVDAWGAGPALHLISGSQALTIAAMASIALAAFARFERDEVLFSVGVSGALLAPFVTAVGAPQIIPLLAFGYVVLEVALTAIRDDTWQAPIYIVVLGCVIYVVAALTAATPSDPMAAQMAPAVFALAFAGAALFVPPRRHRVILAQAALVLLVFALLFRVNERAFAPVSIAIAALGTVAAYGMLRLIGPAKADPWNVTAVFATPMALMILAMIAAHDPTPAAWVAWGWTAAAAAMSVIDPSRRVAHRAVAAAASAVAILVGFTAISGTATAVAFAMHSVIVLLLTRREADRRLMALAVPTLILAITGTVFAYVDLPDFQDVPFATTATLAGLATSGAAVTLAYFTGVGFQRAAGLIVPFFCIRAELAGAFSHDTAMFLLIAYYAIVGVAAVFIGRARAIPLLRHIGLALAIYAAFKAILQASTLEIGLRVGSDFLAGVFMLAVAYWYRVRTAPA